MAVSPLTLPSLPALEREPAAAPGFAARLQASRKAGPAAESVQVAAVRTPLSSEQAAAALARAWEQVVGHPPSDRTVAVLTAQWAHETGRGASMFNYNFGGIKGAGPSGLTVSQRTREGWGATERRIVDNFRAYRTADEGAIDYVALLKRRYPAAIDAAAAGSPETFVRELKAGGYFTGNEEAYVRSVSRMAAAALGETWDPAAAAPVFEGTERPVVEGATADPVPGPGALEHFVASLLLSDEISRAALRIASSTDRERREPT